MRLLLPCLLTSILSSGQTPPSLEFKIFGLSNENNNKEIWIMNPITSQDNSTYFEFSAEMEKVSVEGGKFLFQGNLNYTTVIRFMSFSEKERRGYLSDLYFVEPGMNEVILNDLKYTDKIDINKASNSNKEYRKLKDLLINLPDSSRTVKLNFYEDYVKLNRNSYVALWMLILDYTKYGYSNNLKAIISNFSPEIKNAQTHSRFSKKLFIDSSLSINSGFPFDSYYFGDTIKNIVRKSDLTLIDYWASYCKPCIAQFPAFSTLLSIYKSQGFNIISISIDKKENYSKMESIIRKEGMIWLNKVDDNGSQSINLNISAIPRNFLLDKDGKIIAKNIEVEDLKNHLTTKYKSTNN